MKKDPTPSESHNTAEEKAIKRSNGKIWTSLFVVLFLVGSLFAANFILKKQQDVRQRAQEPQNETQSTIPDEILLRFKPGAKKNIQDRILTEQSLSVKKEIPQIAVKVIKVAPVARDHVIEALSHNPAIDFAEVNVQSKTLDTNPNDPQFALNQWNLFKIQMPKAWDITTGSASVVIAILDTGATEVSDMVGKFVPGYNVLSNNSDTTDDNWHGTSVSSVASAVTNNNLGMAGVSWLSKIMPVKVCDANGYCNTDNVADGIIYAAENGAKIVNMSLGGTGACSGTFQSAIDYAWSKGVFLTAASGNEGAPVSQPANCNNVVAVGSTNQTDTRDSWSNYGPALDVTAPGSTIVCLNISGSGYSSCTGTSVAAPHVAGLASLLFAKGANNITATSAIIQGVDDLGDPGFDQYYGYGRINALKSLQILTGITPTPADTQPPTTTITSPQDGSSVSGGIPISADATDTSGVARVELFVDNNLYASDTIAPYSFFLDTNSLPNGNHTLAVKAFDILGNVASSSIINISISNTIPTPTNAPTLTPINTPTPFPTSTPTPTSQPTPTSIPNPTPNSSNDTVSPIVSISAPIAGSNVAIRSQVNIAASASDNVGVTKVEFYVSGSLTCSDTTASYTCTWKVPAAKNKKYSISAKAYDAAGNNSTASITVTAK